LPEKNNPEIAESALAQARQRLGEEPLAELFRLCAGSWNAWLRPKQEWHWCGLSRYAIDGSMLRISGGRNDKPDTHALHFAD
jgi:hypothetical protein